jgi:SAM-dependent methyltransferase
MTAREFLHERLAAQHQAWFGVDDPAWTNSVVDAWMDDTGSPLVKGRFEDLRKFAPGVKTILDMAAGCGTAVFYGLLNGYDMYGIEPEVWKHEYNVMKAQERGYPPEWLNRLCIGVGENLPYPDNSFDGVSSHHTLEHVQDLDKCVFEMLRVTRPGGVVQIRCPDYLYSTFEGHFHVPWLPLFPRRLAKAYLRALGRPAATLDTFQYTSKPRLLAIAREAERRYGWKTRVLDLNGQKFEAGRKQRGVANVPGLYVAWSARKAVGKLFREGSSVNLLVYVEGK